MVRMKGSASLALLALVYKMSHKACFGDLEKYQNPADLEIYFKLELAIELYWWPVKCLLCNVLVNIAS